MTDPSNRPPIPWYDTPDRAALVEELSERARFMRKETVRLSRIAGAGHYSASFSAANSSSRSTTAPCGSTRAAPVGLTAIASRSCPSYAAIGLYPLLGDLAISIPAPRHELTRMGSNFGDHPDMNKVPGCDFSAGRPPGHGLFVGSAWHRPRRSDAG